ncbi:MAG TPA: hypothetical protein VG370_05655 [Chloroflexota bacterium]|nr:hypothetical protein [Chloroflexota bacterium]
MLSPQERVASAVLTALLLGLFAHAGAVRAAEPYGTFEVTVRDQTGAPISRATIGIIRDSLTGHVRVDERGRGRFSYPGNVLFDFCGGYEFLGPGRPLSCVRGVVVAPGQTRAVQLVVAVLPFEAWVSTFADPGWLRGFTPFWVQSHHPDAPLWSGPDERALVFGTRRQWSYFRVVGPQVGSRLYVLDVATTNYAWIDAAAVGPSGPPPVPVARPA